MDWYREGERLCSTVTAIHSDPKISGSDLGLVRKELLLGYSYGCSYSLIDSFLASAEHQVYQWLHELPQCQQIYFSLPFAYQFLNKNGEEWVHLFMRRYEGDLGYLISNYRRDNLMTELACLSLADIASCLRHVSCAIDILHNRLPRRAYHNHIAEQNILYAHGRYVLADFNHVVIPSPKVENGSYDKQQFANLAIRLIIGGDEDSFANSKEMEDQIRNTYNAEVFEVFQMFKANPDRLTCEEFTNMFLGSLPAR